MMQLKLPQKPSLLVLVEGNIRFTSPPAESAELESLMIHIWYIFFFVFVTENSNFKILLRANVLNF